MNTTIIDMNRRRGRLAFGHAVTLLRQPSNEAVGEMIGSHLSEWLECKVSALDEALLQLDRVGTVSQRARSREIVAKCQAAIGEACQGLRDVGQAAVDRAARRAPRRVTPDRMARRAQLRGGLTRGMEYRPADMNRRQSASHQPNFVDNPRATDEDGEPVELSDDLVERRKQLRQIRGRLDGRMEYR